MHVGGIDEWSAQTMLSAAAAPLYALPDVPDGPDFAAVANQIAIPIPTSEPRIVGPKTKIHKSTQSKVLLCLIMIGWGGTCGAGKSGLVSVVLLI